jgi:hypothetical protein
MKRLLFVGTGYDFPEGAFGFLAAANHHQSCVVVGLFFRPGDSDRVHSVGYEQDQAIEKNREIFVRECRRQLIPCQLHDHEGEWDRELLEEESRFFDLMLLSGDLICGETNRGQPNFFLQEALQRANCPVVVVPELYLEPGCILMPYSDNRNSLQALKQFCYQLPGLTDLPTEMSCIKDNRTGHVLNPDKFREFAQVHFQSLSMLESPSHAGGLFEESMREKGPFLLISGSFSRSALSLIAKRSFAEKAIHEYAMPVFIAGHGSY